MKDLIQYSGRMTRAQLNEAHGKIFEVVRWLERAKSIVEASGCTVEMNSEILTQHHKTLDEALNKLNEVNNFLISLENLK